MGPGTPLSIFMGYIGPTFNRPTVLIPTTENAKKKCLRKCTPQHQEADVPIYGNNAIAMSVWKEASSLSRKKRIKELDV